MKLSKNILLSTALLATLPAFAQEYHSNDLTPAGTSSGKLSGASGRKQAGGAQLGNSGYTHAVLLNGNALASVDLHPAAGFYYSFATCLDDSQQGGWGYSSAGGVHALVWTGSSSSYTDLNPSGYNFSYCQSVHNWEQVGYAQSQSYFVTASHAMVWHGSAASAIDLHPAGTTYPYSRALGCRNGEQVGYISTIAYAEGESLGYHNCSRAVVWRGSADSAVDLHPAGFDASEAVCTTGSKQGGWGYRTLDGSHLHALLWSGDVASVVDLHPAGYLDSKINAMTDTQQVGEAWVGTPGALGSVRHALAWSGTAESVIDLNQYLPIGYTNAVATGIDADGNIVGYAYNSFVAGVTIPPNAIAVVFAPGAAPASGIASFTISPANIAPGDLVQGEVTLSAPAPQGGVNIAFLSMLTNVLATPDAILIPEGETNATFSIAANGSTLSYPASFKVYATDGAASRVATITVTPVVKLSAITANSVEGGFSTWGTLSLSIPAQAGGASVSLSSTDTNLVAVPATVNLPYGYSSMTFSINTAPVSEPRSVPITAVLNGTSVSGSVSLSPAPVISVSGLTFASPAGVVGGKTISGTVTLNNFPRELAGATITLSSGDPSLQVPATVTVPRGGFSAAFTATSTVVEALQSVPVTASYNGSTYTATVLVNPIPTVTIEIAEYILADNMFKVQASTTFTNGILSFGTDPNLAPIGTMQFEQGVFKGALLLDTVPTLATVWNSMGGQATVNVTVKTGTGGNSTGGGATDAKPCKLVVATAGKGSVSSNPSGSSFPAGTVVTLTATPAAGSGWYGWSGDVSSMSKTISVTIKKDTKVIANFK